MLKTYVTLTDRNHYSVLDQRKNPKSSLSEITFFKVNENGEVVEYKNIGANYGGGLGVDQYREVLRGFYRKNNSNDTGFFGTYISKETYNKFMKFAKKNGKVIEYNHDNDAVNLDIINKFTSELNDLNDELTSLENTFRSLELKGKNGRWRKINYKNIIIFSKNDSYSYGNNIQISDKNTNITHSVNSSSLYEFQLKETSHTYYGFYNFGTPYKVLKAGIKGTKKYLEICERITAKNKELYKFVNEQRNNLFQ
jgi:hypothetical protein